MSITEDIHQYDTDSDPTRYLAEERDRFVIGDDQQASWAMRKLLSLREKVQANEKIAESERQRIDSWLEHVNGKFAADIRYFEGLLLDYAAYERGASNRKTVETPYGVVKSRAGQPKWVIDEAEFLPWAKENYPELVRVKEEANLSALKEACTVTDTETLGPVAVNEQGEIIPGVQITAATTSYTIEVSK